MPEPKEIGHQVKFPKTLMGLWKRAWWEIPEVMGAHCMSLIGIAMGAYGLYNYIKMDGDNREYKQVYYIVRNTDPRACKLKNPVCTRSP